MTNIAAFITVLAFTLIVGLLIGRRVEACNQLCARLSASNDRAVAINDEAENGWSM